MLHSRRRLLRIAGYALPALVCVPVACAAASSAQAAGTEHGREALADPDKSGDVLNRGGRQNCPLCTVKQACAQHLA